MKNLPKSCSELGELMRAWHVDYGRTLFDLPLENLLLYNLKAKTKDVKFNGSECADGWQARRLTQLSESPEDPNIQL